MSASETPFQGVRVRYDSAKSYDELVTALLADIGDQPVPLAEVTKPSDSWRSYQAGVEPHVGPSGFMLFALIDHGSWLPNAGIDRRALRVILGNPLIAITMLRHDVTAGLFAPVELLILDEPNGSSLTYVKPSSLMVVEPNPELLSAAEQLDAKLAALADKVTRSDSERGPG
ncbi:hypothetical protein AO501_13620 [Mycobacterium gordonae]|uniref:DUF302 domain-containing protein n=1 Tax=Mycobacterium gordonae TaxID=1778 RepID=A0A0Q2R6R4_MYCGO|nr:MULTISPECIES: DUF302 domain-containing protein [Mycobacterium]KQH79758.1 hypothetical protein AO501_13620 [Mycobacterium gordonae]MDP7729876.1 DUF302 domain-containing protein [Mycobacterium sp. TY813]